jgi:hypothetical protein
MQMASFLIKGYCLLLAAQLGKEFYLTPLKCNFYELKGLPFKVGKLGLTLIKKIHNFFFNMKISGPDLKYFYKACRTFK